MGAIADLLDDQARAQLVAEPFPDELTPMLATLAPEPFDRHDWIFERKLDGQRMLLLVRGGRASLRSRRGERLDATYPELIDAAEAWDLPDLVADGEIVALSDDTTSFALLQQRMGIQSAARARRSPVTVHAYLFDLLHLGGVSTRGLPLQVRKALLTEVVPFEDPYRLSTHRERDGVSALADACAAGWEGLIAKEAASRYTPGRSRAWLKLKCSRRQEVVIGGYTEPKGTRSGFGALLVGTYEDGRLRYAGKVGTGYSQAVLRELGERLRELEEVASPFVDPPPGRDVHHVAPELVAEVAFTEWTRDGRLRHPSFLGLRTDKAARDVAREE
jgi:bifunctional non-homologous end joining protein LigD